MARYLTEAMPVCIYGRDWRIDKNMNGQNRADIKIGSRVKIILKVDQRTGKLTEGEVAKLLTNSAYHPHGIKVMLTDGQVGRVQEIVSV